MLASGTSSPPQVDQIIARLPAFSPVAMRLMAIISDENVSFKEVARLISLDPALSGEVLKLANSGFYGRRASVHSIIHAIALVGIRRVSPIVITAALWKALPRNPAPPIKAWWRHSVASALVAEHVSSEGPGIDSAYTTSLLHGIGQLALFQHSLERYREVLEVACSADRDLLELERQAFGADHVQLAASIFDRWNLPLSMQGAVAAHHATDSSSSPLTMAVHTGCFAAEYVGFGTCGSHSRIATADIPAEVAKLIESRYLVDTLPREVNGIECSLL